MSFFGKFKPGSIQNGPNSHSASAKKDPNAPQPTNLEKHLQDVVGPVRPDGSDKYYGFENYGSTCYCNSIIQCLYYSAPFRENVINFPSTSFIDQVRKNESNGAPTSPRATSMSTTPYPNLTSPARKVMTPGSPGPGQIKQEELKDTPEYKKRMALQAGPVLDMTSDNSSAYGMDESLFTSLRDMFEAIVRNQSRIGVVSPHRFLEVLKRENEMFRGQMHQDAHEFLNLLLNQVVDSVELFAKQHPELAAVQANGGAPEKAFANMTISPNGLTMPKPGPDTHWVHDLFEGLLTSETRCLTCETTSQRDEAFLDLSVDLNAHSSVTSCLRKFSEEEMLRERNKFHCDNCGGLQEAEKRMKIKRLPRILALHLKRFKYTEDFGRLQKLFHRVVYPFHLRLFNTTEDAEDPDRLYELYAVVVHIGGGPYHGHYVSIIKTQDRGWLLFDDELVEPVDKSYVMNFFGGEPVPGVQDAKQLACAYVLFYQETTMEAMLREQEMEAGVVPIPTRTSDVETAKETVHPMKNGDGLHHINTLQTPIHEEMDHMDGLKHAQTAPSVATANPPRPHLDHLSTTPMNPVTTNKSKKELKQEQKQEEKERKAAKKAEEKALDDKRREASAKRMEAWKKQDEEMKQALEASKQSAVEEAKTRGDAPAPVKEKESGTFSRFRNTSMSLRKKPAIFGKDKDKDKEKKESKDMLLPSLPQETSLPEEIVHANGGDPLHVKPAAPVSASAPAAAPAPIDEEREKDDAPTALPTMPIHEQHAPQAEEKVKKHRFSLGRKRSTIIGKS